MWNKYIPPELTTRPGEFLTRDGLSRSVAILVEHIGGNTQNVINNIQFKGSDILFLASEIDYHLEGGHWSMYSDINDLVELRRLRELSNDSNPSGYEELYTFMKQVITKVGVSSLSKMEAFLSGTIKEVDHNNSLMASRTLLECVVIGTRIGIEQSQIIEWKDKLKDVHKNLANRYIFPESPRM